MSEMKYKHVIVVGVDGAGSYIEHADTPNFDRIFSKGAVTYHALASKPTISAECWGSMLLGVDPAVHGLTNGIICSQPYPTDSQFPSLFRRIRAEMPDAELGSFCEWNPITTGIVEGNLSITSDTAPDTELTPRICNYIKEKKPTFLFIQLDSVDHFGHVHGYGTQAYNDRIHEIDDLINQIHKAITDAGILDDTLFTVIADHGGTGTSHGGWTDEEKYVTFAAVGKTVRSRLIPEMNIRDLAAIVLHALGITEPDFDDFGWTAQLPCGIFADEETPIYRDISHLIGAAPRISKEAHTSEPV